MANIETKISVTITNKQILEHILQQDNIDNYLNNLIKQDMKQENEVIEETKECDLDKLFDQSVFDYEV